MTIISITSEDAGRYACQCLYQGNRFASYNASLQVYWAPVKEYSEENTQIKIDYAADKLLACRASGFPSPVIKWFKNAQLIGKSSGRRSGTTDALSR